MISAKSVIIILESHGNQVPATEFTQHLGQAIRE